MYRDGVVKVMHASTVLTGYANSQHRLAKCNPTSESDSMATQMETLQPESSFSGDCTDVAL